MAHYTAEVLWLRNEQDFLNNRYSRRHTLRFDGGVEVAGSSSPHVVPIPMSDAAAVDPEEGFVASLSSCHMLWFLSIAATRKFCVDRYFDAAVGVMGKDAAVWENGHIGGDTEARSQFFRRACSNAGAN